MDPLSITASIVAIAQLASTTSKAFRDLRKLCKELPGRWHALNNEISELQIVLQDASQAIARRNRHQTCHDEEEHILQVLDHGRETIKELLNIVRRFSKFAEREQASVFEVRSFKRDQARLWELQERIHGIKSNLNTLLLVSNSEGIRLTRVELAAWGIDIKEAIKDAGIVNQEQLGIVVAAVVKEQLSGLKQIWESQTERFLASQALQVGDTYALRRRSPSRPTYAEAMPPPYDQKPVVPVTVRVDSHNACRPGCMCACHHQAKTSSHGVLDRIFGQLFIGYSGLPMMSPKCNVPTCERAQNATASVEYWFPPAFVWSQIVRLQVSYRPNLGPQFELKSLRRVPDSAQCVNFALDGNIDGLKDLFRRGLASPRDVSSTRGYSILRWAVYGKQWQTCKFLVYAGADVDYRPLAECDNHPRNKANQQLLMGSLTAEEIEAINTVTQGTEEFIDEQNYTVLHRIVLALSLRDLHETIRESPDLLNQPDAMGRTPLAWAACRRDASALATLLVHGAEPNTLDIQHSAPIGHASDRDSADCVRLLLMAGADPNLAAKAGFNVGGPVSLAARNATDPIILKYLLDFGADVEAPETAGSDGTTALIHASRKNREKFVLILLEHGADINAVSKAGQTPLTCAIIYNSHEVLRLLLDRWFEYTECPRLKGPHLLELVALNADIKTMQILMGSDHIMFMYDKHYTLGDFAGHLKARPDATEKLIFAFDELLSVMRKGSESRKSERDEEDMMEAGMLLGSSTIIERLLAQDDTSSESDDSDQAFDDALEQPTSEKTCMFADLAMLEKKKSESS